MQSHSSVAFFRRRLYCDVGQVDALAPFEPALAKSAVPSAEQRPTRVGEKLRTQAEDQTIILRVSVTKFRKPCDPPLSVHRNHFWTGCAAGQRNQLAGICPEAAGGSKGFGSVRRSDLRIILTELAFQKFKISRRKAQYGHGAVPFELRRRSPDYAPASEKEQATRHS